MADNKNNQNFGANDPTGITQAFGAITGAICAGLSSKEAEWWRQSKLSPIDNEFPLDVPAALEYKLHKYMSAEHRDPKKVAKWISLSFDFFDPNDAKGHPCKPTLDSAVEFVKNYGMKVYKTTMTNSGDQIIVELTNGNIYVSNFKHHSQNTSLYIDGIVEQVFANRVDAKAALFKKLAEYASLGLNIGQSKKESFAFKVLKPNGEKVSIKIV